VDERGDEPALGPSLLALWRLSRPRFWTVSVLPAYVGYVLATRTLVPGLDR
jgi:4-hydroxybenzoate polyprenyltransferase